MTKRGISALKSTTVRESFQIRQMLKKHPYEQNRTWEHLLSVPSGNGTVFNVGGFNGEMLFPKSSWLPHVDPDSRMSPCLQRWIIRYIYFTSSRAFCTTYQKPFISCLLWKRSSSPLESSDSCFFAVTLFLFLFCHVCVFLSTLLLKCVCVEVFVFWLKEVRCSCVVSSWTISTCLFRYTEKEADVRKRLTVLTLRWLPWTPEGFWQKDDVRNFKKKPQDNRFKLDDDHTTPAGTRLSSRRGEQRGS